MSLLCGTEILRDQDQLPLQCNDHSLSCSPGYTCSQAPEDLIGSADFSVCCLNNTIGGSEQDNARPADVWESLNIESPGSDCQSCHVDLRLMCQTMTCSYHPEAVCVQDDCSCEVWFIDANQERVNCEKEQEGTIPPWVFDLPNNGRQPNDDELDVDPRSGSTPDFSEVISPPNQSQDQVSSTDVTIIAVATACVVLVLLAIVAVLLYKAAQKKKSSSTVKSLSRQQEEQLKPLNEPVPHIT